MTHERSSLSLIMLILTLLIIIQTGVVALLVLEVLIPAGDRAAAPVEIFSFSGSATRIDQDRVYWGFIAEDGSLYLPLNLPHEIMLSEGERVEVTAVPAGAFIRTSQIPIRVIRLIAPVTEHYSLTDTRWILETWQENSSMQPISSGVRITMILHENGTLTGAIPTKQYAGGYTLTGQGISLSGVKPITSAGNQEQGEGEDWYLSSLRKTRSFEIQDQFLHLMDENNKTLLTYRADGIFT